MRHTTSHTRKTILGVASALVLAMTGTSATAAPEAFTQTRDGAGFYIPWDAAPITVDVVLSPSELAPYVGGGLDILEASLALEFYDLDIAPDTYGWGVCRMTLLEFGQVAADGAGVGALYAGADNGWSVNSYTLGPEALAALAVDGEIRVSVTMGASLDNPCRRSLGNSEEQLVRVTISGTFDHNQPPTAVAAVEVEQEDGACVGTAFLDASASFDPDSTPGTNDDIVAFEWDIDGDGAGDAFGESATVELPLGSHDITLTVIDAAGVAATDTVTVVVADTSWEYTALVSPDILWPPNHRYVEIAYGLEASSACTGEVVVLEHDAWVLDSVTSDEPDDAPGNGDGRTIDDIVIGEDGSLLLRAERADESDGRTYTLTFAVTDGSGVVFTTTTVIVPRSSIPRGDTGP